MGDVNSSLIALCMKQVLPYMESRGVQLHGRTLAGLILCMVVALQAHAGH